MAAALRRGGFEVVIAQYRLPRFSAREALRLWKQGGFEVPFLVYSDSIGAPQAVELLKGGANDLILKDDLARLGAAIERELREVEERRAKQRAKEESERAAEALRRSEQRFREIVETSPNGILLVDPSGAIRLVNPATEHMFGYAPGELSGKPIEWLVPETDRPGHTASREAFSRHPEPRRLGVGRELHARRKDGSEFPAEIGLSPFESAEGPMVIATVIDVTERRRAVAQARALEGKLQESEEHYRLLFESNPYPMWAFDLETLAFLEVNGAAVAHYGWTREEFLRMTVADIRPEETLPAFQENIDAVRRGPTAPTTGPWRHRKKDGGEIQVEVAATTIRFHGRRARLVLAADVTEKKALETRLLQAQKMEAIGRLTGGVAHDFNNLLGVIMGYGEMARRQLAPEHPVQGRLEQIQTAAARAADLTRQMLAFSRQQVLHPLPLDLNAAIAGARKMLERMLGEDVVFVERLAPNLGTVMADPSQMDQVLMNLAVNARDAMPRGGTLTFETSAVDLDEDYVSRHAAGRPGPHVMLSVTDTGVGMDDATQSRIFEPFFTTKPQGEGTGLGLATVYGIVKQSGGFIWVYSEPGQGATFKIYLPRMDQPARTGSLASPHAEAACGTGSILVVEDQESLRRMIQEILEHHGYTVLAAADGEAALELARRHTGPLDLLLSDVVMPGMNGRELADRLGVLRPGIRALFMSGYSNLSITDRPLDLGTPQEALRQRLPGAGGTQGSGGRMTAQACILVAEDDPALLEIVTTLLAESGFRTIGETSGSAAIRRLRETDVDVVLTDIQMPDATGVDVLRCARERNLDTPVILMTGNPTLPTAVEALKLCALGYLTAGAPAPLLEAVSGALRLVRLTRLRRQALAEGEAKFADARSRIALPSGPGRVWMAYQPVLWARDGKRYGHEALLRTTARDVPHVGAFLEVALRVGATRDLGRTVRAAVAHDLSTTTGDVLVNLHPLELTDPQLGSAAEPLTAHAERVVLEITERESLDGVEGLRDRVGRLRARGFRIAIDDLGAGYAALSSFASLEPDIVKLDMSLVRGIDRHQTRQKLVTSLAELCRDLSILVIAEGIETEAERRVVAEAGCDLLQGFLLGRPAVRRSG
jgi:PAS domain S-box-containing protein